MKYCFRLTLGLALFMALFAVSSQATASEIIGLSAPIIHSGNGSQIQYYDPARQVVASDRTTDRDGATSTEYLETNPNVGATADSSYKTLKGGIWATGEPVDWQSGGFYRDQIYFTTDTGQPAVLAMTFHISAHGETYAESAALARLSVGWNMYTSPTESYAFSYKDVINLTSPSNSAEFDGNLTLTTMDGNNSYSPGYLVGSGTYVPFSISLWGTVNNGYLDWPDTLVFVDFAAYDEGGAPLKFTITEGIQGGNPVPIPGTLLLLLSGGTGLGMLRRWRTTTRKA